jgi:DNA polymerase-3 subunit alpha
MFEISEKQDSEQSDGLIIPVLKEYPEKVLLNMEKEMMGLYLSGHPLDTFKNELNERTTFTAADIAIFSGNNDDAVNNEIYNIHDGQNVIVGGIITDKKIKTTKNNNMMAFLTLEDLYGSMEIIVFPSTYERYMEYIEPESIVLIEGKISIKEEEEPKIICQEIKKLTKAAAKKIYLKINDNNKMNFEARCVPLLRFFNGATPVYVYYEDEKVTKIASKDMWVELNDNIINDLESILGNECVKVVGG